MKKYYYRLIIFLLFVTNYSFGQLSTNPSCLSANLAPNKNHEEDNSILSKTKWIEKISERTLFSSTFLSNDGQIKIVQSKRPINYYNSSKILVPIDSELKTINSHSWGAIDQPNPTYLYEDGTFSLTLNTSNRVTLGKNCSINGQKIKGDFVFKGNMVNMINVLPGINKEIFFYENTVKYNYIINQNIVNNGNDIIFSEEIDLPAGHQIQRDFANGKQTENGWNGNLIITDEKGNTVSTLYLPLCFDDANNFTSGSYKIREENNLKYIDIILSSEWLNDTERIFPVVIDPIVTGPTSTWSGGNMPSCILPATNIDSIQVTIPAGVTVTGLFVTASFYADPFTTAIMSQGSMSFSTNCATSNAFTISGTAGASPGTAYLDYYNLFNPLTCCFPESCNTSNFYLTMHLGRTGPSTGCTANYIRYDVATTLWPFEAVVVGKTAETYGGEWLVPSNPICSNQCSITGTGFVLYGVPPYTFSHPWSSEVMTLGQNNGCANGATNYSFTLDIPNCPSFCDNSYTTLSVPPPTIVDACGNLVTGMPVETVPIKMTPDLNATYDTLVCSGQPYSIFLTSCEPNAIINWSGNGISGTTAINDNIENNSTSISITNYLAYASDNGCYSDTILVPTYIQPLPISNYSHTPEPIIAAVPVSFIDASQINSGIINSWEWTFGDGNASLEQNPTHTYLNPGVYAVCLKISNDNGCIDSLCQQITVVPAEITAPNIITVNNDGTNELLEFKYLEFYPDNEISIFNRWGTLLYSKKGYLNDWSADEYTEGTYFYILKVNEIDKTYSGFFQLVK